MNNESKKHNVLTISDLDFDPKENNSGYDRLDIILIEDTKEFPESFLINNNIKHVFLSMTELTSIPENINELTKLECIVLGNNENLKNINSLIKLKTLKNIYIGVNQFASLDVSDKELKDMFNCNANIHIDCDNELSDKTKKTLNQYIKVLSNQIDLCVDRNLNKKIISRLSEILSERFERVSL